MEQDLAEQAPQTHPAEVAAMDSEKQQVETGQEGKQQVKEEEQQQEALTVEDIRNDLTLFLMVCSPCLFFLVVAIVLYVVFRNQEKEMGYICHEPPTAEQVLFLQNHSIPLCLDAFYGDVRINDAPMCVQRQKEQAVEETTPPPSWCYANLDSTKFLHYASYYLTWGNNSNAWHIRNGPWDNLDADTLYRHYTTTDTETSDDDSVSSRLLRRPLLPPDSSENVTWEMRSCSSVGRGPIMSCIYTDAGRPISFRPCQTQNTTLVESLERSRRSPDDADGIVLVQVPDVCVARLKSTENKIKNVSFVLMIVFAVIVGCPLALLCCAYLGYFCS